MIGLHCLGGPGLSSRSVRDSTPTCVVVGKSLTNFQFYQMTTNLGSHWKILAFLEIQVICRGNLHALNLENVGRSINVAFLSQNKSITKPYQMASGM